MKYIAMEILLQAFFTSTSNSYLNMVALNHFPKWRLKWCLSGVFGAAVDFDRDGGVFFLDKPSNILLTLIFFRLWTFDILKIIIISTSPVFKHTFTLKNWEITTLVLILKI